MSSCITYEDIINHPTCCNVSLCCSEEVVTSKIDLAVTIIEDITGSKICPYDECRTFKCSSNGKIFFIPETTHKLLEATSVTYVYEGIEKEILTYTNNTTNLDVGCSQCTKCGHIKICGSWASYATIPETIKEAVRLLTLEKVQPGITGLNGSQGLVRNVEWDDFKLEYNDSQVFSDISSTGFYEIDRLISNSPTSGQIKFSVVGDSNTNCCKKGGCGPC